MDLTFIEDFSKMVIFFELKLKQSLTSKEFINNATLCVGCIYISYSIRARILGRSLCHTRQTPEQVFIFTGLPQPIGCRLVHYTLVL